MSSETQFCMLSNNTVIIQERITPLLTFAVLCVSRKSSGHKVVAVGGAEVPRGGRSLAADHLTDNVEALMPMISAHFIDAKVRHMQAAYVIHQRSTQ